ncbi:MAG: MlaA family lipoprotein [Pseudomonadota bacterium]|nr:MlaA family lipoprotein [Pseudomonadota bacterium]
MRHLPRHTLLACALFTLSCHPALAQEPEPASGETPAASVPAAEPPASDLAMRAEPSSDAVPPDQDAAADAVDSDGTLLAPAPGAGELLPDPLTRDPRTQAERDFDAIYGGTSLYNPVADPTLPEGAVLPSTYDPWEGFNRQMHRFNNVVDQAVARPLARTYVRVVPRPIRLGIGNFFSNLGQPVSAVNALLQGRPVQAAQSLSRFALNSTLGIGGVFDPATDARLPNRSEDFGQTLAIWGWERSRYVELPLFGPRTLRDTVGLVGDAPLSPLRQVEADQVRIPLQGLQLVDVRAQLLSTDSLREGAEDDYALVRDAWSQRRAYQIFGDRLDPGEEDLPDYLRDDTNPQVPADAIPLMPMDIN